VIGAFAGGRLGWRVGQHRGRFLAIALSIKVALFGLALLISVAAPPPFGDGIRFALIILLASSMGVQNAAARRLGVPDVTTTVLTLTLTGFVADSTLAGGSNPRPGRRLLAIAALFVGALTGTLVVVYAGIAAALALGLGLILFTAAAAYSLSSSTAAWTLELG
jgi:uncharacterized membrane protein YoaK (UPF0700 family)